jgi:hypothetical protein
MNGPHAMVAMVRADFLERVRRYSFLLTLAVSAYLAYAVYSGKIGLTLGDYRGVDNSAWLGSLMALVISVFVSLIGFYVVKNAIQRDRETRVGQILATTPMSKAFYTLSKALSNFAVLAAMVLVLAAAAPFIQLATAGHTDIDFVAFLLPILVFGLGALAVTAGIAILFETIPVLRGGVGNVIYFFVWIWLMVQGLGGEKDGAWGSTMPLFSDYTGIGWTMHQMRLQLHQLDPAYKGGASFGSFTAERTTKTFLWTGMHWEPRLIASRVIWLGIALAIPLLAAVFFDRFDPARGSWRAKKQKPGRTLEMSEAAVASHVPSRAVAQLTPLRRAGSRIAGRSRFFGLVIAEVRLMLQGHGWWWYVVAAGLFLGCIFAPLPEARSGVIAVAWLWPALLWSQMGTREARYSTQSLIFSAPRVFPRQLLAVWTAGVLVAAVTGGGLGLRLLALGDFFALSGWAAAALFIPALALALGVLTESRKPFEALYTVWWYIGVLHQIPRLDFMATSDASARPLGYFTAAILLVAVACAWRKARLATV